MGLNPLGNAVCGVFQRRLGPSLRSASQKSLRLRHVSTLPAGRHFAFTAKPNHSNSQSRCHQRNIQIRYASSSALAGSTASSAESVISSASGVDANAGTNTPSEWSLPFETLDSISVTEPRIGYLKELGLDYGIGPTSIVQWAFEHLQVDLGLPAWAAVVGVALVFRIGLLGFAIPASDMAARLKAMNPRIKPIREKMSAALASGDQTAAANARQELSAVNKAAGIKLSTLFWPMLLQAPLGFGLFRLTKGMADLPVPGLDLETLGWITSLGAPDPLYILPIATAGLMYSSMKRNMEEGATTQFSGILVKILPSITLFVSAFFPALTQIGFFTGSVWQVLQAETLRLRRVRQTLGLHPLLSESEVVQPNTYQGTMRTQAAEQATLDKKDQGVLDKFTESRNQAFKSLKESYGKVTGKSAQSKGNKRSPSELKNAQSREVDGKRRDVAETQERKERDRQLRLRRLQR